MKEFFARFKPLFYWRAIQKAKERVHPGCILRAAYGEEFEVVSRGHAGCKVRVIGSKDYAEIRHRTGFIMYVPAVSDIDWIYIARFWEIAKSAGDEVADVLQGGRK